MVYNTKCRKARVVLKRQKEIVQHNYASFQIPTQDKIKYLYEGQDLYKMTPAFLSNLISYQALHTTCTLTIFVDFRVPKLFSLPEDFFLCLTVLILLDSAQASSPLY